MKRCLLVLLTGIMAVSFPYLGGAQVEEEVEYGYGTVVKVNEVNNELVVSEYDWESDSDVTVTYSVDSGTEFEGVSSLKEITPDKMVEIEYLVKGEKKVAKYIGVYESEPESGAGPEQE